nr:hypothetical protein [Bacilli bacterium]
MKKKIKYLLLTIFMICVGIGNTFAADWGCIFRPGSTDCISIQTIGASGLSYGRMLTDQEACRYGRYGNRDMNAVRLTVVDTSGTRVSKSIDVYSGSLPGYYANTRTSTEKKTRNEILSSGTGYTISGNRPSIDAFPNLPGFKNAGTGASTVIKNYFINNFASVDTTEMIRIFGLMGYDAYKDILLYENHWLLIEPIYQIGTDFPSDGNDGCEKVEGLSREDDAYVSGFINNNNLGISKTSEVIRTLNDPMYCPSGWHSVKILSGYMCDCNLSHTYYYGTATEIFSMMKQSNDRYYTYKVGRGGSVETTAHALGGLLHDDEYAAGLADASGLVAMDSHASGGVYSHMLDNSGKYGLGAMHIRMKYILNGCPNGECPTTCPDGTVVPEGQDPAAVCPPSYCPDMQTVIPYGKTAAEVCPNYTPTCDYSLETRITNDCTNGQEGYIKDIGEDESGGADLEEWKCIFDTATAPMNTYEGEFYHPNGSTFFDNNRYCRVACRETVKYKLPSSFEEVAGRKFTIGKSNDFTSSLTQNIIEGTSTCSTAYYPGTQTPAINYELFKMDYNAANIEVVNTWNAYQTAIAKEKAFQAATQVSSSQHDEACVGPMIDDTNSCPGGWSEQLVNSAGTPTSQAACDACSAIAKAFGTADCGCHTTRSCPGGYGKKVDTANCNAWEHGSPKYTEYKWSGSFNNGVYSATVEYITTSCGGHGQNKDAVWSAIQAEKSATKAAYDNAVNNRRILLETLNECNNFQRTYNEFEPTLSFAYSETKYKGSYKLFAVAQTSAVTRYLVNNQQVDSKPWTTAGYADILDEFTSIKDINQMFGSIDYVDRTDCGSELQPCVNNVRAQAYPNNTSVIQITRKTYEYDLPGDANRYVAKNGKSYDSAYDAELSDYPYIDTGRTNLPINYETPAGWYHYYYDYYYADGTANLFGTNQKFLKYNKVEPGGTSSYNGLTLADNLLYHCIYKVDCGMLECPDDSNTCPDGSEMPPDGKCPDYTITQKICPSGVPMPISGKCPDNKGINIIYRTISLDNPFPGEHGAGRAAGANWDGEATVLGTRMSFIDAYITNNRGVSTEKVYQETPMYQFTLTPANIRAIRKYNRSTGNDYNDYNFECSNGKYCKSEFLEEGIGNGYFGFSSKNPNGGSCFNAYSTDWESCRYSSIGG